MSRYITAITDRTENDIINKTAKAYFNIADWKRITDNNLIVAILLSMVYSGEINLIDLEKPVITTIPTIDDINNLAANINLVRELSGLTNLDNMEAVKENWIAGVYAKAINYEIVNTWEKILETIKKNIVKTVNYMPTCGVGSVGQGRFYQVRWRVYQGVAESIAPVRHSRTGLSYCGEALIKANYFRRYD